MTAARVNEEASPSSADTHGNYEEPPDPLDPLYEAIRPPSLASVRALDPTEEKGGRPTDTLVQSKTNGTTTSITSRFPEYEVTFESGDGDLDKPQGRFSPCRDWSDDPKEWPLWYRCWIIFCVAFSGWVVVLYSTSYTSAIPALAEKYGESEFTATLGLTSYLLGIAVGVVVWAPLSELYGRRYVYIGTAIVATLLILPALEATSLTEIIVVRFFGALFGSAMISNSPGSITDIAKPEQRALYLCIWSIAPMNGPSTGPLVGGFAFEYLGLQWNFIVVIILTAVSVVLMSTVKETYAPAILRKKAERRRKMTGDDRYWSCYDEKKPIGELLKDNMGRPFVLAAKEPILWFFNVWIALIYGILYLCFVAYPIVFGGYRGWDVAMSGLSFMGIGIGVLIGLSMEKVWRNIINSRPKDPATGMAKPEATALIMLIGSVFTAVGQLAFALTCLPVTIHPLVSIAMGVIFGFGNTLTFIYGAAYMTAAYGRFAASALASNAVVRSVVGGLLPLAGDAMFDRLGPRMAGVLLAVLEFAMIPIPFVFFIWGEKIRAASPAITALRMEQQNAEERAAKMARRKARHEIQEKETRAASGTAGSKTSSRHSTLMECPVERSEDIEKTAIKASDESL